jgi:penicillin amidase
MEDWVAQLAETAGGSLRPLEGHLDAAGLDKEVEVFTDPWGVPHVFAESRQDLYFAQGYLHATERLWQVDLTRRLAQGRLAELLGEFTLPFDKFFRTLGLGRAAKGWLNQIDEATRRVGEPYARGFVEGAKSLPPPIEYQILAAEPEIPSSFEGATENTFAIALMMAFTLSFNYGFELLRAWLTRELGPERARELSPFVGPEPPLAVPASDSFPGLVRDLTRLARETGRVPGVGSNNWVVSGDKSATGKPLLANDPHLQVSMPSIWMEMHLSSPDMEVAGVTIPGIPGVILGHNRRVAWGFTNTGADVEDLYLERLSEDGTKYEFRGEWHPVEVIREEIRVRHEPEPRIHEVRLTRHGPLLTSYMHGNVNVTVREDAVDEALAFRWIHHEVVASQQSIEGINCASNWEEFREAVRLWPAPGQNMVFADIDGNIGYQFTGQVPVRPRGSSGAAPLPGWTGQHEWTGTVPFDELPCAYNPEAGFLATANHRMVDLDYPHYLTDDWEPSFRIRRIVALLNEKQKLSSDDFARIQMDVYSGIAASLLPLMSEAITGDGRLAEAVKYLQTWDRQLETGSVAGTIFQVWTTKVAEAIFRPRLGGELYDLYFETRGWTTLAGFDALHAILTNPASDWVGGDGSDNVQSRNRLVTGALESALQELEAKFGPDMAEWRWGRLHQVHFRHPLTTAMPPLDGLLSIGPLEASGGDDTINRGVFSPGEDYAQSAVSSYRQIIDLADFDRSLSVITTGNSGNPASPFYRDQAEMWRTGGYHPAPFSRTAVEEASLGRFILTPA